MPQLNFLDQSEGNQFSVNYWSNPLHPEEEAHLQVRIKDRHGNDLQSYYARVPHEVLHELPLEVGRACWEAWLFGNSTDVKHAFQQVTALWRKEARTRKAAMERGLRG